MGICGLGKYNDPRDDPKVGHFYGKYYPLEIIDREDRVKSQPRERAKHHYNLQKNLTLTVKPQRNIVRSNETLVQNIPILINLHTTDYTKQEFQNRSPIDLICIVDKSGSMEGQKMALLKRALNNLLRLTKQNDRICIIQFDSKARQLTPLLRNTRQNSSQFRQAINSLTAEGDNNMNDALKIAFQVLKNRSTVNPITSIFILTDGIETSPHAHQQIKRSLLMSGLQDQNFAISCFGFGNDHDQQLLVNVASLKDGNFYYIQTLERIDESFTSALAGLMSIVGLNTIIQVKNIAEQPFKNIKINKTFGDKWETKYPKAKSNNVDTYYNISLNQLEAGKDKGFIAEINVPPFSSRFMSNYKRVQIIVLQVNVQVLDKSKQFVINLSKKLRLTIINDKQPPVAIEDDGQVLQNYYRIKGALAIESAVNQANNSYYNNARQNIQNVIDQINKDRVINKQKLKPLVDQLKKCQQSCQQNVYQYNGRKQMRQNNYILAHQQAAPTFSMFNNHLQNEMISQTIMKRGNY